MSTTFRANALCRAVAFAVAALATAPLAAQTDADVPTGRLPRTVEPTHRTLELRIDPESRNLQGRAGLDVEVARATDRLWLHGRDLDIARAAIVVEGGERLPLKVEQAHVSGVLALTAPTEIPAGRARIEIEYAAPYGQLQGAYKVRPDGNDYVVTQMEPLGARNAFPGFDEPSFKTPWDISLVVPQDQVAVANTRQVAEEDAGDGWKRLRFARTEALPSYLIAFAVGPWDVVEAPDLPPNAVRTVPLPLRGIAAEGRGDEMDYALAHTGEIVDALETYFGIAYPFDKLDILAAPDFWAGAMENAGLIVYRDSLLLLDEESGTRQKQAYWGVHAHELAHQWFGNLVTMPWWNDLWLNEAFATWMGNKIVGQLQPGFHTDRGLLEGAYGAMAADSLASTRRIGEPVHDFTDVSAAFDGITYQKGGAVLAMFERYLGEEAFRQGVRSYLQAHARGNATAADLIAAVAARSDDPERVRAAFASYIEQPGVPLLKAEVDCDDPAAPALVVAQSRFLPLGSRAQGGQRWGIPVCVRTDSGAPTCQLVSAAEARIALPGGRCPTFVMPNAGANGYYRFDLAADDRAALAAHFDRLDPREQRAFADSLDAAYQTGTLDTAGFLQSAARLAGADARQTVTAPFERIAWILEDLVDDPATAAAIRARVAAAWRPRLEAIGLESAQGESDETRLLRSELVGFLAAVIEDRALRAELASRGRQALGIGGDDALDLEAVSPDLRGIALAMTADAGDAATFDVMARHLRASGDATLRSELLRALGRFTDPALAARARALVLEPDVLRRNEVLPLLDAQMGRPALREATRDWLDAHWGDLEARLSPSGARLVRLYATGMCGADDADALRATFGERVAAMEGGPRALDQAIEHVGLCGALREAQRAAGVSAPRD